MREDELGAKCAKVGKIVDWLKRNLEWSVCEMVCKKVWVA